MGIAFVVNQFHFLRLVHIELALENDIDFTRIGIQIAFAIDKVETIDLDRKSVV